MGILSLFFPRKCPFCNTVISGGETECEECRRELYAQPIRFIIPSGEVCLAPAVYEGKLRDAVLALKFRGRVENSRSLAKAISELLISENETAYDVVTCIPMTERAKAEREYNQSEEIARRVSEHLRLPFEDLMIKIRDNQVQHRLSPRERAENVKGVYSVKSGGIEGKRILLIDDICTTGNTLSEACRVLKNAGAVKILCSAAAIAVCAS